MRGADGGTTAIHGWFEQTMGLDLHVVAIVLTAVSGVPGLVLGSRSSRGQRIASVLLVGGAVLGLLGASLALSGAAVETVTVAGPLPDVALRLRLDPLAAFFLVPIYVLGAAGTVYGLRYWKQSEHAGNGRELRLWFGVLVAALAGVVLAADAVAFLVAWEVMAIAAFFLVTTEDERAEVQQAGWVYLVATHAGTLALFALFGLLWSLNGSTAFQPLPAAAARPGVAVASFLLALLGFGLKAGIVPMHFWLPAAHANAPSHVSALLSGVVLKMGIYGLLRILTLLPIPPPGVGLLLIVLGVVSAVYGVVLALGQHDLKCLLAYHSIENIGIIVMGLGLALLGQSAGQPAWAALGLAGCLLHVWNHALFKSLLFLAAGSVIHGVGTREIERLGGLGKSMAGSAAFFAIGAVAICGLPPLNGFVSELLIYIGLFRTAADGVGGMWPAAALAAPLLAMVGALAVACFVKAYGTVFLGPNRSEIAAGAHESPPSMLLAMLALAVPCVAIGALPILVMPVLDRVVRSWLRVQAPPPALGDLLPWTSIMGVTAAIVGLVAAASLLLRGRRRTVAQAPTWDCGYARPTARMAYTASSFAEILVHLYAWLLQPRTSGADVEGLFPRPRRFHASIPDPVMSAILLPLWARSRLELARFRVLQQGRTQQYLLYVLLTLCILLALLFPMGALLRRFLGW